MREANEAPCLKGEFPKQQEILKEHQSSPREQQIEQQLPGQDQMQMGEPKARQKVEGEEG